MMGVIHSKVSLKAVSGNDTRILSRRLRIMRKLVETGFLRKLSNTVRTPPIY